MKFTFCLSVLAGMYPGLSTLSYKAQVNIERRRADAGCGDGAKKSQEKLWGAALGIPSQTGQRLSGQAEEPSAKLGGSLWCMPALESPTLNTQQSVFHHGYSKLQASSHRGKSQCSHKDRELILMTDMPPCCKSLETQNAGNGEDGNKRPNARTLHPVLPIVKLFWIRQTSLSHHTLTA